MNKITYLFGAGASKNALPIVNEIPDRIEDLVNFLIRDDLKLGDDSKFNLLDARVEKSKREYQIEMITTLEWLMKECKRHASIDTYAKKLFLKRDNRTLKKLKIALSIFFVFEQARNKPDNRYDTFFASILNN